MSTPEMNTTTDVKQKQDMEMDVAQHQLQRSTSVISNVKDPVFRRKLLLWLSLPIGMFTVGVIDSQGGATILDLQIITKTDQEKAAFFFTAYNLGYLLGSLGGFCHGKINSYLLMGVSCILAGLITIASPYCTLFVLMFMARLLAGCFLGAFMCIMNAEHMAIWGTNGEALLQLLGFIYAVGGVAGPLSASPFLAEKEERHNTSFHQNTTVDLVFQNTTFDIAINETDIGNSTLPQSTNVHYAFLIGGSILLTATIPFFIAFFISSSKTDSETREKKEQEKLTRKLPLQVKIVMVSMLCAFYFAYCSVEVTINSYLMSFIVDHFEEITPQDGAYFSTLFLASFAVGRFISIFTSKYISAVRLLYIHLTLLTCALTGFTVSAWYSKLIIVKVFMCMMGLACSAIFSSGMSWTEAELVTVSGPISGAMLVGASAGAAVIPFVVGHLMEYNSNLWFCYCLGIAFVGAVLLFVILLVFNRSYIDKKYGKLADAGNKDNLEHLPSIQIESVL